MSDREGWLDDYAASVAALPEAPPSWDFSDPFVREALLDVALGRTPPARHPSVQNDPKDRIRNIATSEPTARTAQPTAPEDLSGFLDRLKPDERLQTHGHAAARRQQEKAAIIAAFRTSVEPSFQNRADRLKECGRSFNWVHVGDNVLASHPSRRRCRDRMDPYCNVIRTQDLVRQFTPLIRAAKKKGEIIRALVINRRDPVGEAPEDAVAFAYKYKAKLLRSKEFKKHVKGGIWSFEMTYNAQRQSYHPHFHFVTVGTFWHHKRLEALLRKILGDPTATPAWIYRDDKPLNELLGYPLKPGSLFDKHGKQTLTSAQIVRVARALAHRRLVGTFGSWKGQLDKKPKDETVVVMPMYVALEHAKSVDPTAPLLREGLTAWGRTLKPRDQLFWALCYARTRATIATPDPVEGRSPTERLRDAIKARLRAPYDDNSPHPNEWG